MDREWLFKHGWLFAWLLLIVTAYLVRSPLPVDETRYLGVAWEMWLRGDFLVPYLNGEPYSHKPPLLFWLFQAGWAVFGINEWWPRLVPSLFALAGLYMSRAMAKRLWPDRPQVAMLAPWLLCGGFFWTVFTPVIMFDMVLTAIVMLALLGLLRAGAGGPDQGWGWLLMGAAIGMGILCKGPVMLLHVVFPVLLAPWWSETARQRPLRWYGFLLGAVTLAIVIALAWALPAASAGGEAYKQAILWHQTTDRMVSSFAHRHPVWWYLPLLPVLLFPWFIWPPLWRAVKVMWPDEKRTSRFLLSWLLPTFIAFSLISAKQPQYLLPLLPGFALFAARSFDGWEQRVGCLDQLLPALLLGGTGLLLLILPLLSIEGTPDWTETISPLWGLAILVVGALLLASVWERTSHAVITLAVAQSVVTALLMGGFFLAAKPVIDIASAAHFLSRLQAQGAPIANIGSYYNQFHFLGRLKKPFTEIRVGQLDAWRSSHPGGYVVTYKREAPAKNGPQPVYKQRYRGHWLAVWAVMDAKL